jgi:2-hydroxychromene-2-carboxylate isomerase
MHTIDFYFDFASPYAYLAAMRIDALAERHGCTVRWRPVLLAGMLKVTGAKPSPLVPLKGEYVLRDLERTARRLGIAYREPAEPVRLLLGAPRAMLWIGREHGEAAAATFARRCFQAYFAEGIDIGDERVLVRLAAEQGIDGERLLAGMASDAVKAQLKEEGEAAIARGVFGVPFVFTPDGEPFWGADRLEAVEEWLRTVAQGTDPAPVAGAGSVPVAAALTSSSTTAPDTSR